MSIFDAAAATNRPALDGHSITLPVLEHMAKTAKGLPVTINFGNIVVGQVLAAEVLGEFLMIRVELPLTNLEQKARNLCVAPFGVVEKVKLDAEGFKNVVDFSLMGFTILPFNEQSLSPLYPLPADTTSGWTELGGPHV